MTDYPFNADKPVKADTIANFCTYTEQNAEHLMRALYGFVRRAKFRWKDADEIYIGPGCYHHYGSTRNRLVWWNSELTFQLGSGGSNASSDDVDSGAVTWHYIYIDDSAVNSLASNELTAVEFLNDKTAPTWSDSYHGWYNGNDRCIGAVLASAANEVIEFFHDGGDAVFFANQITEATNITPSTTWTDIDCATSMPAFSTKAMITFLLTTIIGSNTLLWRTNGQTATSGHYIATIASTAYYQQNTTIVITDTSQIFEVKCGTAANDGVSAFTDGWYFPRGM